jgi:hypothetical protein
MDPGGGREGQGRTDSRGSSVAGRRVHRDAGTASAADGQAGARELSGSFRPRGWSGLQAPPALEDQPPLGVKRSRFATPSERLHELQLACPSAISRSSRARGISPSSPCTVLFPTRLSCPRARPDTTPRQSRLFPGHWCHPPACPSRSGKAASRCRSAGPNRPCA